MTRATAVRAIATLLALAAVAAAAATAAPAGAAVALTRVSADPFTNATSQHATEVEPDTFASGATVVAAYQVGRFFDGGASDIGYARSSDGGASWDVSSFLPGLTFSAGRPRAPTSASATRASPTTPARVWMVSSIPLLPSLACRRSS